MGYEKYITDCLIVMFIALTCSWVANCMDSRKDNSIL